MEAHTMKLESLYKCSVIPADQVEEYGDEITLGECWEFQDPDNVDFWSLVLIPTANIIGFISKYRNAPVPLPLSLYEQVTDGSEGPPGFIYVTCVTTDLDRS